LISRSVCFRWLVWIGGFKESDLHGHAPTQTDFRGATGPGPAQNYRWLKPFIQLLRQGVSPEKIALTIALGIVLGVTPVLGSTMLLCTLAAILLRLNLPAIQLVNGVVYPLQFILLVPFYRLGAWMFRADASAISLGGVTALIQEGVGHAIRTLWVVTMHALLAWLVLGVVTLAILYVVLVPLVRQLWRRVQPKVSSPYGR
jgi:uncharacterized protein (DUF2062 family)